MTKGELKDIIKECLLEISTTNIALATESNILVEDADFDSLYESYIEEANNFDRLVVDAINEKVNPETIKKMKDKVKNVVKTVINKIKSFIIFIKDKIVAVAKKMKEKISNSISKNSLKKAKDNVDVDNESKLDKYLSSEVKVYSIDPEKLLDLVKGDKLNNILLFSNNKDNSSDDPIKEYKTLSELIDKVCNCSLTDTVDVTVENFIKNGDRYLECIKNVYNTIANIYEPEIKYLTEYQKELERKIDDMDTADEDKINSVEELNISNQLTLIPRRINFITEFTTLMLKICYEYDDVYWKIYHKLESLKSK